MLTNYSYLQAMRGPEGWRFARQHHGGRLASLHCRATESNGGPT